MADQNNNNLAQEQLLALIYDKLVDLDIRTTLIESNLRSLQQDVSHFTYVRSELFKLRYDHKTNELYITEFFKIPFTGNEAVLLSYLFKKSNGLPKKSTKFYPAELAGSFENVTDGLKTTKSINGAIDRIDKTIKYRTMGLEVFKISSKVFYFL